MPTPSATKQGTLRLCFGAFFLALALIFSYIESLLPPFLPVPGIKLGLANAAIALALYLLDAKIAFTANLGRIVLAAMLFGNPMSMLYSLCGALMSMGILILLKKRTNLSAVTLCAVSGAVHNFGQLLCAMAILQSTALILYLPALLLGGILAGSAVGLICVPLITRLSPKFQKNEPL